MRIAYIVLTCEKYKETRLVWQKETVFSEGKVPWEDVYYLGHTMRESERLFSWGASDDYNSLPLKFVDFFVRTELGGVYDWFFLIDDDTYVYVDRMRRRIAALEEGVVNPQTEVYAEGYEMTHVAHSTWGVYLSGGAGTLLSAAGYRGIQERLRKLCGGCSDSGSGSGINATYEPPHFCADICLGLWLKSLPGFRMVHYDGYHTEMAYRGQGRAEEDLTFHHLKEKEDYWAHWRIGREN